MSETLRKVLEHEDFPEGTKWRYVNYAPGETVLKEGETTRGVYLVVEGTASVNMKVELEDNRSIRSGISKLVAGDTFGELNLFDALPRSATVTAETDLKLIEVDGVVLAQFLDDHTEIGYEVLKEVFIRHANQLRQANERVTRLFSWGLRQHGIDKHL